VSSSIFINEIHPNQESGSEWVELILVGDEANVNLLNYTIFDSARQIFKFSNEQFSNQLLVVELTGLNNDQDSVILKDNLGNVLDSFSYTSTTKGLSWAKNPNSTEFTLSEPTRGQPNLVPTPSPTPSPTITPTQAPSSSPTANPSGTPNPTVSSAEKNTTQTTTNSPVKKIQYPYYRLDKVQLQPVQIDREERLSRLVFLGQKTATTELKNAIIGSFLLILGASYLLYAKFKKNHP
jgi:hypothetical protein